MARRALLLLALGAGALAAQERAPRNDSITERDLRADLFFLAGDSFRGRLTGTAENHMASEFLASRFRRLGLRPMGSPDSYLQRYNLMTAALAEGNLLEVAAPSSSLRPRLLEGFHPHRWSASGRAAGGLVFVGFGLRAPSLGHDDYKDADVRGRLVLALEHEPGETDPQSPFDGVVTSEPASLLRKTLAAQERGAAGILFVRDVHNHPEQENFQAAARNYWPTAAPRIERFTLQSWMEQVRIPAAQISAALGETLAQAAGRGLAELSRNAEAKGGARAVPLAGVDIVLTTNVTRTVVPDENVLAGLVGSDPRLKDEWVIVSSHHDHNGADGEQIYAGADDNGSGTVGVLEIAEAFALAAADGARPRRSVLFASFNSEERGLLGAWASTEQPPVPLESVVAVLNMDMVGRNEEVPEGGGARFRGLPLQTAASNDNSVTLLGFSRSASLTADIERANAGFGLVLKKNYDNNVSNLLRRSDHWPFLQRGVPALWFHTGLHPDYHTVYDRPEKINYAKMEKIVRLVHQASWDLAQQDSRPRLGN
jgi:hypothetical protein